MSKLEKQKGTKAILLEERGNKGDVSANQGIIDEATAKSTATEYCLFHYPTLYTAGAPCLISEKTKQLWVVPIVLASPTHGVLGEVGQLQIDAYTGKVITATDRAGVVAKGEQLFQGKSNAPAPRVPARSEDSCALAGLRTPLAPRGCFPRRRFGVIRCSARWPIQVGATHES